MQPTIRSIKLADTIADYIQDLIREGALAPGDRLISERELAAKLNVSRPSLRDALSKLVESNLLMTDAQGTAYVSKSIGRSLRDPLALLLETPEGQRDCMEMRAVIEASAAGYAALRASDLDRETLTRRFEAMEAANAREDVEAIARTDAEFHFAIYEASHNLMMMHFMRSLESSLRMNVYLNRTMLYERSEIWGAQLGEHRRIYEAIMARDTDAAQDAASQHMATAIQAQRELRDAERRLEASTRRLSHRDLVAPPKRRVRGGDKRVRGFQ
jgi:GntR family transcriptional repressor for pyruvate dehydrogenase complex